ncbi:MAG: hypothetical protein V7L25_13335 [Nostoc sp.]|uniref:hypothetical protein n=1 Tax=Nostoc sp. TaxID=1180 RepID=UPI002FF08461
MTCHKSPESWVIEVQMLAASLRVTLRTVANAVLTTVPTAGNPPTGRFTAKRLRQKPLL